VIRKLKISLAPKLFSKKGNVQYLLAMIVFCTAVISGILLFINNNLSLIYFGDAVSHIVRARQFIDSQQPGLMNIGTVWLPLPQLLLVPFVAFDTLFYSGIAGATIGIPLLTLTAVLIFSIIWILTNSRQIAFIVSLLFGLNPNIVYIALTPMSEISLIFFVTLGGYGLVKWIRSDYVGWLFLCTGAVFCATLCRYEAWLLAPFISVIALHRGRVLQKQGMRFSIFTSAAIAGIAWCGIAFWLCWNYLQYSDALKFAHWTYSVGTSTARSALSTHPADLYSIAGNALLWIFGPMMLGAGVLITLSMKRLSVRKEQVLLLLYFSLPAIFILSAILGGFVQVDQWWWNWRFVLSFGLFLSLASALALQELFQKWQMPFLHHIVVACFVVMPVVQIAVPSVGVAVYKDAEKSFSDLSRSATILGQEMQKRYHGGSIALLTGYGAGQRVMISSGLPLKSFNVKYFTDDSTISITDRYIIIGKDRRTGSLEFSQYWTVNKTSLLLSYELRELNDNFVLLERKTRL